MTVIHEHDSHRDGTIDLARVISATIKQQVTACTRRKDGSTVVEWKSGILIH